jgi:hypothetical protein
MIFNINIKKKYANKKLEYMFSDVRAENYSMYDTWFKNKFNMSSKEIFKEHYNNFKPTLDQIEKFDVTKLNSAVDSANLAELKCQAAKTFTQADMKNLFSIPYNKDARLKYLHETLPDFQYNPVIDKYKNVFTPGFIDVENLVNQLEANTNRSRILALIYNCLLIYFIHKYTKSS